MMIIFLISRQNQVDVCYYPGQEQLVQPGCADEHVWLCPAYWQDMPRILFQSSAGYAKRQSYWLPVRLQPKGSQLRSFQVQTTGTEI